MAHYTHSNGLLPPARAGIACALLFATWQAAACSSSVQIPGPMPTDTRRLVLSNVNTSQSGNFVQSYFDTSKIPFALVVTARGDEPKRLSLGFSKNVDHIRVLGGTTVLYEGEPLKSLEVTVPSGSKIRIEFTWEGEDVRVGVGSFC